ncbi:type I polyketide synthase [Nocardiopsis sp. L17-MgMaSL7]|uniref:type I polyketide synthase n=1 Tax=Nocardiopsis sp. L17-MgMaSL7 TaxID=1938893 RepID=UPI000D714C4E|nr:type I polyketide synthase [Nocardiopsis sp. L17-MgMaSL7]PWV58204.1 acyl transferase domain-containing protein [Nocardiopsis sp. L17-MgMaSL7]
MTDDAQVLDYLKRVTADLRRTRAELDRLRERDSEPIAVVGMGCRLPGGVDGPEGLWDLLDRGTDAIGDWPEDRGWDIEDLRGRPGMSSGGGFIRDVAGFDSAFFGISPREAEAMDPQQRLMLEVTWESLERAGIDPHSLAESSTGVFTGISTTDYARVTTSGRVPTPEGAEGYLMTGTAASVASGRIAYTLGLRGPALTVDTACSSSLASVLLAVRSLRRGECTLALAGGATVMSGPSLFLESAKQGVLSHDGRCRAFGDGADGTGFAEGAASLVLERLSNAERHGHPVLAVIRGGAVNQDGASSGLTAPSGPAQSRVIRAALADAGVEPDDIDVVEAHGTGTELGDPIESDALLEVFGARPGREPLWLGSVKSNVGHTQGAAGAVGIVKMVLALNGERLPRTLHADQPTSLVDWASGGVRPLTEARDWPRGERVRRAGVSAFGISGTNVHLVLEEAPVPVSGPDDTVPGETEDARPLVEGRTAWLLSARDESALRAQAARLADRFTGVAGGAPSPESIARSLATTRARFDERAVVVGGPESIERGLRGLAAGEVAEGAVTGVVRRSARPARPVFVFPGQGGQWAGMGRDLMADSPVFAASVAECERALAPLVDWSLSSVLREEPGAPPFTGEGAAADVLQPAVWAFLVSLARMWRAAGVEPTAVVGHSQGEVAAACVAGILSIEDGARVVVARSRALAKVAGEGGIAVVGLAPDAVAGLLDGMEGRLVLSGINGPTTCTVAGTPEAVDAFVAAREAEETFVRRLPIDYASHSFAIDRVEEEVRAALAEIKPRRGTVPFHSTVAPERVWRAGDEPPASPLDGTSLGADYWFRNLRHGVLLEPVVRRLAEASEAFVEVGPHPVLAVPMRETLEAVGAGDRSLVHTLQRDQDTGDRFLAALAEAHCQGVEVDWRRVLGGGGGHVDLPTYPFQRRRYWLREPALSGAPSAGGLSSADHPLIAAWTTIGTTGQTLFTGRLDSARVPWLSEHTVSGRAILPGTASVELLLRVGRLCDRPEIAELTLTHPLEMDPDGPGLPIQIVVEPPELRGTRAFQLLSSADGRTWTSHAEGLLGPATRTPAPVPVPPGADATELAVTAAYPLFEALGVQYGPSFRGLREVRTLGSRTWAESGPDALPADAAALTGPHPVLLDSGLQSLLLRQADTGEPPRLLMPFGWSGVRRHREHVPDRVRVQLTRIGDDTYEVLVTDPEGVPLLSVDSLSVREAPPEARADRDALFHLDWEEVTVPGGAVVADPGTWAVTGGSALGVDRRPEEGDQAPAVVVLMGDHTASADPERARERLLGADPLRGWVEDDRYANTRFVVLTRGAVRLPGDTNLPVDPSGAALWGLVASAETENPGRFLLLDADRADTDLVAAALRTEEPRVAARNGRLHVPRLARSLTEADEGALPPARSAGWRLRTDGRGIVGGLTHVPVPERALAPHEVRVAVRAAGLNFRDVLMTVGMYPEPGEIGNEGSGVVLEAGDEAGGLRPGDRVMGLFPGAFGPVAVADHRYLARVPESWDHAEAAAVPAVYLTAYLALVEEAGLRAGETVLIHSAAGGVGQAALGLAQYLGARVLATASPGKWELLRAAGLEAEGVAHSREPGFEKRFRAVSGTVDVVLNSLTGDAITASLRLLAEGGRFVELGRNELLGADDVPEGVTYRTFNVMDVGPERIQRAFAALLPLLTDGTLTRGPLTRYPIEEAPEAFQVMQRGHNVGKAVLELSTRFRPGGTVLVTGASGRLGALVTRHLVLRHGVEDLLLVSRRGSAAPGTDELVAELTDLGANVRVEACDVADEEQLRVLLEGTPVSAVVHAAAAFDDSTFTGLTKGSLDLVMAPKAVGAWNLHRLTAHLDLDAFVLFSSAAGVLGSAGQAAYSAANAYLDALAEHRRELGLPAQSLAWGRWLVETREFAEMNEVSANRMARTWGVQGIGDREGCALLDAAMAMDRANLVPSPLDLVGLRTRAITQGAVPALMRGLVRAPTRVVRDTVSVASVASGAERRKLITRRIRERAAEILGYGEYGARQEFPESGFDSLTSVELRNHLQELTGLRLPVTLVFQHGNPEALAWHLDREMGEHVPERSGGDGAPGPGGSSERSRYQGSTDSLVGFFVDACVAHRPKEAVGLALAASRTRAVFTGDSPAATTTLASGPEAPVLICHPSLVMTSGPHEFARFASRWQGRRRVHVVSAPGYLEGEELPADLDTFVRSQADQALAAADGSPFVLVGRSSGGWTAHAVAEELARRGTPPAKVVLLDTVVPGDDELLPMVTEFVTDRASEFELLDTPRLTAMGAYLDLFASWRPSEWGGTTVQVRPTEAVVTAAGGKLGLGWSWPTAHDRIEVPGDHFTMMEEWAPRTAEAVGRVASEGDAG